MAQAPKTSTPAKAKAKPTLKPAKAAAPAVKTKPQKAAKPAVVAHKFGTDWHGASDAVNSRTSRTPIDFSKFGSLPQAALTDRDQKAIEALRKQFGPRSFERGNLDAGIIRRLGERGVIQHVSGSDVDPKAQFKLTRKGLGQAAA